MELILKERKKLTRVTDSKYRKFVKREKTAILDTLVEQDGYEQKYATLLLISESRCGTDGKQSPEFLHASGKKRIYEKIYNGEILNTLVPTWEAEPINNFV